MSIGNSSRARCAIYSRDTKICICSVPQLMHELCRLILRPPGSPTSIRIRRVGSIAAGRPDVLHLLRWHSSNAAVYFPISMTGILSIGYYSYAKNTKNTKNTCRYLYNCVLSKICNVGNFRGSFGTPRDLHINNLNWAGRRPVFEAKWGRRRVVPKVGPTRI